MIAKLKIWWTALDSGWKFLMAAAAIVTTISTVAIKVNKGIELMTETATNVKLLVKNDTIQSKAILAIQQGLATEGKLRSAYTESYVDHLKLEKRLDEVIKFYERMARAEEKKNFSPTP